MHINSIIMILDLVEKIVGKAAKHEKMKKPKSATDKILKSIAKKYKSEQIQK